MIFTTFQFLIFFAVLFPVYFLLPRAWRHPFLLVASYYFYMCSVPVYITIIIAITLIDFVAGIKIEQAHSHKIRRLYLTLSILCNFGLLFALKYAGFFASSINGVTGASLPVLRFVLPLGISFHTFQAVSYTVEVYRGRVPAERDLLKYALYVAFFPQMVAGPIERPYNLLPQFHTDHTLTFDNFESGFRIALWGAFKKVVLADLLAPVVSSVYAAPRHFSGPILALATFFFAIQIYCDFSGYSDIAIGIARMMGYKLMINFRQPYFASSVAEFWHRWHISLSTWFRDYLYIPLGGNRVPKLPYFVNIMIVFLVSGLWHGANWTFAVWGGLHGLFLIGGSVTAPVRNTVKSALGMNPSGPLSRALATISTFLLVTAAWVFFRCASVRDGIFIIGHLFDWRGFHVNDLFTLGLPRFELALSFVLIAVVAITEWFMALEPFVATRLWSLRPFRWACYQCCIFAMVFFGVFGHIEFIYFQF